MGKIMKCIMCGNDELIERKYLIFKIKICTKCGYEHYFKESDKVD